MEHQYWIKRGENIKGPFTGRQLIRLASAKKLKPCDYVSEDRTRWVLAGKVKGLPFGEEADAPGHTVPRVDRRATTTAPGVTVGGEPQCTPGARPQGQPPEAYDGPAGLRREYQMIEKERKNHAILAVLLGAPGLLLTVPFVLWMTALIPNPGQKTACITAVVPFGGFILYLAGCMHYAEYKGRSRAWGIIGAFTFWSLPLFLPDKSKARLKEIAARLEQSGEPLAREEAH